MKYIILVLLVLTTASSQAQITLEHTYPFTLIQLVLVDTNDVKYFGARSDSNFEVYNANHSLYKSIPLPKLANGERVNKIQYLSRHLFNTDDKLEFLVETYPRSTLILNEDGLIVFECNKCSPNYPLANGSDAVSESVINTQLGTKLFLTDSLAHTLVFSLPGKLPGSSTKSSVDPPSIVSGNPLPTSAYPNPSNGQMRISYKLPLGESTGELVILTTDGVEVKRYRVGEGFNDILVEKGDLSSGSYFYKLVTEKGESETKKLIILK